MQSTSTTTSYNSRQVQYPEHFEVIGLFIIYCVHHNLIKSFDNFIIYHHQYITEHINLESKEELSNWVNQFKRTAILLNHRAIKGCCISNWNKLCVSHSLPINAPSSTTTTHNTDSLTATTTTPTVSGIKRNKDMLCGINDLKGFGIQSYHDNNNNWSIGGNLDVSRLIAVFQRR